MKWHCRSEHNLEDFTEKNTTYEKWISLKKSGQNNLPNGSNNSAEIKIEEINNRQNKSTNSMAI